MTVDVPVTIVTAAAGIVVAIITGFVSYRSAGWNLRKDLEVELRRQRLEGFKKLWALSEPLCEFGRTGPFERTTTKSLEDLSSDLRHWYYAQGGIFLSEESRDEFIRFQEALRQVIQKASDSADVLDEAKREELRQAAGDLRTSLRHAFKGFPKM